MKESSFQTSFGKWAKHNIRESGAYELKVSKKNRMPLSAIKPHQIQNLLSARERTLVYKIADVGYEQKPFDCFVLSGSGAYLVILFYLKRGDKTFYIIDIQEFVRWRESTGAKSITKDEAESLASTIGVLASSNRLK